VVDAAGWTVSQLTGQIDKIVDQPLDIAGGPIMRATLLRTGSPGDVLVLVIHHLAADGIAHWVVMEDLFQIYNEMTEDQPAIAPFPPMARYRDYVAWQRRMLNGQEGCRQAEFWSQELEGVSPVVALPSRGKYPVRHSDDGGTYAFELDQALVGRLREMASVSSSSLYVVLLSGFLAVLHAETGCGDLLVASPTSDRIHLGPEYQRVVGDFSNRVLIRSRLKPESTAESFLGDTASSVERALENALYPISLVVEELAGRSAVAPALIGDVVFNLLPVASNVLSEIRRAGGTSLGDFPRVSYGEVSVELMMPARRSSRRTLGLQMVDGKARVGGMWAYRRHSFSDADAQALALAYERMLKAASDDPGRPMTEVLALR
jgi:hypothetical protein